MLARAGSARAAPAAVAVRPRTTWSWQLAPPSRAGRMPVMRGQRPVRQVDVEDAVARQAALDDVRRPWRAGPAPPRRASRARALDREGERRVAAQRGLEGGADGARVRDVGAHVAAGVDAGHDEVGDRAAQAEQRDAHAVRRGAVAGEARRSRSPKVARLQREGAVDGDAARHRAGVAVGGDGRDVAEAVEGAAQHGDAGGVDAVVVGEEDLQGHGPILAERRSTLSGRRGGAAVDVRAGLSHPRRGAPVACGGDRRPPGRRQE